jgi:hypothetical protein
VAIGFGLDCQGTERRVILCTVVKLEQESMVPRSSCAGTRAERSDRLRGVIHSILQFIIPSQFARVKGLDLACRFTTASSFPYFSLISASSHLAAIYNQ